MAAFFLPFVLFFVGFAVHLAIWHIHRPRATGQTLIVVMIACILGCASIFLAIRAVAPEIAPLLPATASGWMEAVIAALGFAAAYVISYPAIEVPSPTLVMIDLIAAAEPTGLTKAELYGRLNDEFLVIPRIEDLLREGLANESGGRICLTRKGLQLEQIFAAWRRFLGAGIGG